MTTKRATKRPVTPGPLGLGWRLWWLRTQDTCDWCALKICLERAALERWARGEKARRR